MKKLFGLFISFVIGLSAFASGETDELFLRFPNSGVNFEALYANPTDGTACIGDFNEDGKPDLIVMGPNYNEFETSFVNLILNNGNKTFTRHDLGLEGLNNGSVAWTKTGAGHFLLAIQGGTATPATNANATAYVATLKVHNNQVACTRKQNLDNGLINGDILFVDFNNDGHPDIVSFGGSRKVYTYLNDGNNNFSLVTNVTGLTGTVNGQSKAVDVNRDGRPDIICIDQNSGLCVYLNTGKNAFTKKKVDSDYGFKIQPRFETGDFDNDGHLDIVAFDTHSTNASERSVVFFYGNSTGHFVQDEPNDFMGVEAAAVAVGDFNNDGNADVLYAGSNTKISKDDQTGSSTFKAYILLGDGNRHFTSHVKATPVRQNCDIFSLCPVGNGEYHIADFDGDGKPDIFVIGELGINIGGKVMRRTEMFLSSLKYGFGEPIAETPVKHVWEGFDYNEVRLLDGRLKETQDKHIAYLKSLDVNRLFAATLEYNLGIKGYEPYGGWEAGGYGSSFAHYLSAISMAYAATHDPELLERINQSMDIIIASQDYNGDGFFAFKDGTTYAFDYAFAKRKTLTPGKWDENGHSWDTNGVGIPLYAHHKLFASIRDAYLFAGHEGARVSFLKFCEWMVKWIQNFDHQNFQNLLLAEHGGFVEIMADAYRLSGDPKYLAAAEKFTQDNFAEKIGNNIDDLSGRHSNFYCPMAVGAAVHYYVSGNQVSRNIAHNFFHIVNDSHTLCNGSNGSNERFGTPGLLTYRLGMRGPESCSSYNMLKLAKELFLLEGTTDYLDYYENTMYNHILGTLSPHTDAGVCYHTSLKPGTFRIYDNLYNAFWCCVGTGMESHVKYVDAIYFKGDKGLLIDLFVPSTLDWKEKGLKLTMNADFPNDETIRIRIDQNVSFDRDIVVRYPSWAAPKSMKVRVNGAEKPVTASPGGFVRISHAWAANDEIEITIPCKLRLVDLPDDIHVSALFYGPVMLAANFGEVGQPDVSDSHAPSEEITNPAPDPYFPELKISRKSLEASIRKTEGKMEFTTRGLTKNYTLKPFYDTHHCRYNVYWKIADATDMEKEKEIVPDHVIAGVPESENAHQLSTTGTSNTGAASFSFWGPTYFRFRDANTSGSVSYDMNLLPYELPEGKNYYIQLTYFGSEPNGYGNFRIAVDGTNVAYQGSISYLAPLDFAQRYYEIPRDLTNGKRKITVKFFGGRLSLYGVRLTTTDDLIRDKRAFVNTDLKSLSVSEGILSPAFDPAVTVYAMNVPATAASLTIAAETANPDAAVGGTGEKNLQAGENLFPVIVTAADGSATRTYTITVNRAGADASSDNTLKSLSVSDGALVPAFSPSTEMYTVDVDNAVADWAVAALPNHAKAVVAGTGEGISLNEGENDIPLIVTAEDGSERTYTLKVSRKAKSTDASLMNLIVSEGSLSPAFDPEIQSYTVTVDNQVNTVELTAVPTHSRATVQGDGIQAFLEPGDNQVSAVVTAEDGVTQRTYQVNIHRTESTDATLRFFSVLPGEMTPSFSAETTDYTVEVDSEVSTIVILATANHAGATVTGAGEKTGLHTSANPFTVKVTAQDGVTEVNYNLNVVRKEGSGISDVQDSHVKYYVRDGVLFVSFDGTADIQVVALSGMQVDRKRADESYSIRLEPGVYMLAVDNEIYKIVL